MSFCLGGFGFGKSLCICSFTFEELELGGEERQIVVVVTPLTAIMKDVSSHRYLGQSFIKRGLDVAYVRMSLVSQGVKI